MAENASITMMQSYSYLSQKGQLPFEHQDFLLAERTYSKTLSLSLSAFLSSVRSQVFKMEFCSALIKERAFICFTCKFKLVP